MENKIQFKEKESEDLGENFDEKMNEGEDGKLLPDQDKKKSCFKKENTPPKNRGVKISSSKNVDEQIVAEAKERRKKRTQFKTVKEPKELKNDVYNMKDKFIRKTKKSTR